MRTTRRNRARSSPLTPGGPVKMKIVEILEAWTKNLRVMDIVEITGISKSKVYQQIARGELQSVRIDGSIKIDPNHAIQWWKRHETGLATALDGFDGGVVHRKSASAPNELENPL